MRSVKHGNPKRSRKHRRRVQPCVRAMQPTEPARLTLHRTDVITGCENTLFSLFYEFYRGYTIYSTQEGHCCIHTKDGCLRIQGRYACFPDVEQAKNLIKYFQADGRTPHESSNRFVPEDEYLCLNGWSRENTRQRNVVTYSAGS